MTTVDELEDINEKKIFIFLEFTRHRSTCEKIVELLIKSGNDKNVLAAHYLEVFNRSSGPQICEFVIPAKTLMKGSGCYDMDKNPRGKCVIINNHVKYIENSLFVDLNAFGQLYRESIEFKSIFSQLCFEVELINNVNTKQIREVLNSYAKKSSLSKTDAFIVMIITHGANERINGFDACVGKDQNDVMPISEVVNIFSESNCPYLMNKPKIFFFNCCRIKKSENNNSMDTEEKGDLAILDSNALNNNPTKTDSFVCYSCAKGELSWNESGKMSLFGEALSRSIKQYCGQESFSSVMQRTCVEMKRLWPEHPNYKSAPEIRGYGFRRLLYFNPGFPE